jgi:hypothetical protein
MQQSHIIHPEGYIQAFFRLGITKITEQFQFSNTLQSSLPDTSIEGSVREKSTLHALFSCSSYSITLCQKAIHKNH